MNVLVTGGGGFLGGHLRAELRRRGHQVNAPPSQERDLRDPRALFGLTEKFDQIYHLAAWTQAGRFCDLRRGEQWIVNQQINANTLAYWHEAQPQAQLIALGTSASYAPGVETREDRYLEGQPLDAYYAYAESKRALLVGLRSLNRQFGHRFLYLVPSTLYGPGYRLDGRELHFIYDLIRKILRARAGGPPATLIGDGEQRRELVHAHDAARWMCELADGGRADGKVVNLGAGESRTIREFAGMICAEAGLAPGDVRYDAAAPAGVRHKELSTAELERLLPNRPRTPFSQGLAGTIAWMRAAGPA